MSALKLLNAVTSTGASLAKEFTRLIKHHTVQVNITGAPTAVTVTLEGSLDGVNFRTIATHALSAGDLTATTGMFFDIDKPVLFVKVNLTVFTGGTAPTVTVYYEGDSEWQSKVSRRGAF